MNFVLVVSTVKCHSTALVSGLIFLLLVDWLLVGWLVSRLFLTCDCIYWSRNEEKVNFLQ